MHAPPGHQNGIPPPQIMQQQPQKSIASALSQVNEGVWMQIGM